MNSRLTRTVVLSLVALVPAVAQAGPPLVCWPMSIGNAPSLPWGAGWHDARPDYQRSRLADDTLALLGAATPALVRMETLRRAALYAESDDAAAMQLFMALRARVDAAAAPRARALATFDLGYEIEAYRQSLWSRRQSGRGLAGVVATPENGYALVHDALVTLRPDAQIEYAAALMALSQPAESPAHALAERHARMAAAGAAAGSDLARTMAAHAALWGGRVPSREAFANR